MRTPRPLALAAILAAALAARTPLCAQVVVGAPASGIQVAPGGQVTVPVVVDMTGSGGFSLGSLAAQLSWKASTLRFVGATGGAFGAPTLNPDSATGTLRFAVANPAGATGQVVVLQATFDATGPSGDTTYLNVAVSQLTSATTFTDLTPVTTSSLLCVGTASGVWGDLDNSGTVTSFDALLIVTHAVGLPIAPNSPALGDVDADGQVTTRDALIVLTYVVSLPTPGFRPGQPVAGACGGPPPKTVMALPSSVALVVGDTVPLTAEAQDSLGQIASVPAFAWATLDSAVATVDAAGRLAAVGAGVTGAVVAVAPGVMDTVGVTVVTTRTIWYVDIAAAAQNQTETGSPAYPFGALQPAVDRAAANDTIYVRGGVYGTGARSTKPLTIAGHPSYVPPWFGGAITFDSVGAATVRLRRLVVRDAASGIIVHGLGGGLVVLDSVVVERARGHGIEVSGVDSAALDHVMVTGAVDKGIVTADVRALAMFAVAVDGVALANGPGTGTTLLALRTQRVDADSSSFRLGGVVLDTVADVHFHRVSITESTGPLFTQTAGASAVFDTVSFRMGGGAAAVTLQMQPGATVFGRQVEIRDIDGNGILVSSAASAIFEQLLVEGNGSGGFFGSGAAAFAGVGRVEVHGGTFRDGAVFLGDTLGNASVLRLDTVDFDHAQLVARGLDTLVYDVGSMTGGGAVNGGILNIDTVQVVSLSGVEVTGQPAPTPAVVVAHGDSLRADSLYVHDNAGTGMHVDQLRTVSSLGSRFVRNSLSAVHYYANLELYNVPAARVAQGLFEELGSASLSWYPGGTTGQTLTVDTTVFQGSVSAVTVSATYVQADVTIRGSRLERSGGQIGQYFLQGPVLGRVQLFDNQVDSTLGGSSSVVNVVTDSLTAANNVMRGVSGGIAANPYSGRLAVALTGNTVECLPTGFAYGLDVQGMRGVLTGNTVRGCYYGGIHVSASAGTDTLEVRGNTVTDISTAGDYGIGMDGAWRHVVVAQNTVQRGGMHAAGIFVYGTPIDTALIDSNTVQDGDGAGIRAESGTRVLSLRGNLVERQHQYGGGEAAIWANNLPGPDSLIIAGNRVQQNTVTGIIVRTAAPVRLDSNVVVDDSVGALLFNSSANVTGQSNFLARNGGDGIYVNASAGSITISQSVIQQNAIGARFVTGLVTLANNYWGDLTGPRCDTGCVGALGDSLVGSGSLNYVPFLTSAPSTPVGAPPMQRPTAPATVIAAPIRSKAVEPAWFEQRRATRRAAAGGGR